MRRQVLVTSVAAILVSGCSATARPSPTPPEPSGSVVGSLQGGCFGYGGPPNSLTITVQAVQGGAVKASTKITETKSDTSGGSYRMLGTQYRLTVPQGQYDIVAAGPNFTINGRPWTQGRVSVHSGETVAVPTIRMSGCS